MFGVLIFASLALLGAGFFYSARSLRRLVYLLFALSLVEGAYINYFFPSQLPLFLKDGLVGYMYLLFLAQGHLRPTMRQLGALAVPLLAYGLIYVAHLFNPELDNLLVGLVGLRVALFYIPLLLVGRVAFDDREQVLRFFRYAVALTVAVCAYGVFQYFGGATHVGSLGPGYVRRGVAILHGGGAGDHYSFRTLATFTYSSSFSIFVQLMMPFVYVFLWMNLSKKWRAIIIAATVLLLMGQLSSGGRQALIFTLLGVVLTEVFSGQRQRKLVAALSVLAVALVTGFIVFGKGAVARYETIFDYQQVRSRYQSYLIDHNLEAIERSPLGHGAGVAATAARHVGGLKFFMTETFVSKTVYEVGLPGLAAFLWAMIALWRRHRHAARYIHDPDLARIGHAQIGLASIVLLTSLNGWPLDVPPLNALFWLFAGIALALPALGRATEPHVVAAVPALAPVPR
jgi:hypothetical protein